MPPGQKCVTGLQSCHCNKCRVSWHVVDVTFLFCPWEGVWGGALSTFATINVRNVRNARLNYVCVCVCYLFVSTLLSHTLLHEAMKASKTTMSSGDDGRQRKIRESSFCFGKKSQLTFLLHIVRVGYLLLFTTV